MDAPQLYRASLEEAKTRDETGLFWASHKRNVACKRAIETAIRENFDGMHLNKGCLKPVIEEYGFDQVEWVLANTLQQKDHDGRFSRSNKEWAKAVPIPESSTAGYDLRWDFMVESHPAVLDGFISMMHREQVVSREQTEQAERKPSIKGQLSAPPVPRSRPAERKNDREVR